MHSKVKFVIKITPIFRKNVPGNILGLVVGKTFWYAVSVIFDVKVNARIECRKRHRKRETQIETIANHKTHHDHSINMKYYCTNRTLRCHWWGHVLHRLPVCRWVNKQATVGTSQATHLTNNGVRSRTNLSEYSLLKTTSLQYRWHILYI